MKQRRKWVPLILLAVLLTGCWDRIQLEDQYYIVKLGLDQADDGQILVSAQVAATAYLGTGVLEGSSEATEATTACYTLTTVAGTITHAIHRLNGSSTRSLTLKHLGAVIIGEKLGREGIEPYVMELWRQAPARSTALIAQMRQGTARRLLEECQPQGELNVARVPEGVLLQQKRYHLAPPVRLHHVVSRIAAPGGDAYMPSVAINPGRTGSLEDFADGRQSALAGEVPRLGGNPWDFVGTAIYRQDRLAGFLTADETQMLLALRGEMGKAYISFPDPAHPNRLVTMRFQQENLPQYRTFLQKGKPRVRGRLLFEGELLATPGGTDYVPAESRVKLEQAAVRMADQTIRTLLTKLREWGADPVGFGHKFRNQFADWPAWVAYDWRSHIPDLEVDVTTEMRIRRYGMYTGPDRTRGGR